MKALKVLKSVAFVTSKEWGAYRSHIVVSLFLGPLFFLTQYFIWNAVYTHQTSINNMTLTQILTYYGLATLTNYLIMDSADWNLQMLIRTGRFITFLLFNIHFHYNRCCSISGCTAIE